MRNSEDAKEQAVYELCFLILPSIPEDSLPGVTDSIRKAIAKEGGSEIAAEEPFKHPLAYPISKTIGASRYILNDAYIGWIKFEAEPSNILAVKAAVEKIGEVVRFLLIKASRETHFTFAKARALAEEKERKASEGAEKEPAEPSPAAEEVVA